MAVHKESADDIERMLASGELLQAAAALRHRGELARAQELYERTWDLENAAAVARERGDRMGLLRIALRGQDPASAIALAPHLRAASAEIRQQAAVLYEQYHQYFEAAELREALGEVDVAYALYQRAGGAGRIEAARIDEQRGELAQAIAGYAAVLAEGQGTLVYRARAAFLHGSLLLRCGDFEAAVCSLQEARRLLKAVQKQCPSSPVFANEPAGQGNLDEIEAQLIEAFLALGEADVAQSVLASYRARQAPGSEREVPLAAEFLQERAAKNVGAAENARLLGRYRLLGLLGAGSMGRVYLAEDDLKRRQVAVKLLPLAGAATPAQLAVYRRFCLEARVLSGLHHPNLIELYDFHPEAGILSMEYMPSGALSAAPLPLPLDVLRRVLCDVVLALQVVHGAGVIHRDIKPHNLFISPAGAIKLGDFGAASLRELGLTQTEGLIGTLAYMAPEQIRGEPLTFATDLYGLGVTAFELATGRLPFPGPDFIDQHLGSAPPDACALRPGLPAAWAAMFGRLLEKAPAGRYSDLETLHEALKKLPVPSLSDAQSAPPPSPPAPVQMPLQTAPATAEVPLLRKSYSTLVLSTDARLGRPLFIERFAPGLLQGEAGAGHLAWLRQMAALAGPGLQRVLRIDLHSQPSAEVHYEAPEGHVVSAQNLLSEEEQACVARVLSRLHAAGIAHGSLATALVLEPAQPLLLLSGHGPLAWSKPALPADDLLALASVSFQKKAGGT